MTASEPVKLRRWVLDWAGPPPPNQNGTTAHSRWSTRKARARWRMNAVVMAIRAGLPQREICRYRVDGTFFRRNLKVADEDGDQSRLKSVIDGLVDGQYLPGDNRRFVTWGPTREAHGPPGFRLVIQELPADAETIERARRHYTRGDDDLFTRARPRPRVLPGPREVVL